MISLLPRVAAAADRRRAAPFAALVASALLAACSSTPLDTKPSTPSVVTPTASSTTRAPATGATSTATAPPQAPDDRALAPYLDPSHPLSRERSVYFGFDQYAVPRDAAPVLERHGNFLAQQPQLAVRIEGHTDERGGAEYNLALGQRRAEAVRQALRIYGVKDTQMEAISWGSEKPRATGQTEEAWAQNRRADIVYPAR